MDDAIPAALLAQFPRERVVAFLRRLDLGPRFVGRTEFVDALEVYGLIRIPGPRQLAVTVEITTMGKVVVGFCR
jgi:hypothetical protein